MTPAVVPPADGLPVCITGSNNEKLQDSIETPPMDSSTSSTRSSLTLSTTFGTVSSTTTAATTKSKEGLLLELLAQQLVQYFDEAGADGGDSATDTYLQTLLGLNDGCIPCRILVQFVEVQQLLRAGGAGRKSQDSQESLLRRAVMEEASGKLEMARLDGLSGKRVTEEDSKFVWAVRPLPREQWIEEAKEEPAHATFTNVVLLRDVPSTVTFQDIVDLLEGTNVPPVQKVVPDVACCWFVTFDCDCESTMLQTVLTLRSLQLGGSYIQCRLRNTSVHHAPSVDPIWLLQQMEAPKQRRKKRGKKKKQKQVSLQTKVADKTAVKPLRLGHEEFPTLGNNTVEWATSLTEEVDEGGIVSEGDTPEGPGSKKGQLSDGASTATTTSSSTDSVPKKGLGGYAAAVLNMRSTEKVPDVVEDDGSNEEAEEDTESDLRRVVSESMVSALVHDRGSGEPSSHRPSNVPPSATTSNLTSTWGGRRSFVDIARLS